MKIFKLLPILLIFTFILTATIPTGIAYTPDPTDKVISIGMLASETEEIVEGTFVDILILIKNFSNATLNNVTITQLIPNTVKYAR